MLEDAESFVLWVERKRSATGRLAGRVEWTRRSERVGFTSPDELIRFLERCVREPGPATPPCDEPEENER